MNVRRCMILSATFAAIALTGCHHDRTYDEQRPDMTKLSPDDTGLQSKDVIAASDQMARDLLTNPRLNASPTQLTVTVGQFIDQTSRFGTNYNIFIERLRSELSEKSGGRITLIENKDTFHQMQGAELDGPLPPPTPANNPTYILYGKAYDMPNRSTNYFMLQFDLTNLQTREQVWSRKYEVKTSN